MQEYQGGLCVQCHTRVYLWRMVPGRAALLQILGSSCRPGFIVTPNIFTTAYC